jgi:1-phosphatidylinositol-3-phosphate 5-kinase
MTRHFEKLGKEARRTDSRYAVIRGKRARPVASSKAKVEVLDSLKDAIEDESDDASSSSEADDEGDGNDDIPSAPLDTVTNPPSPAVVPALAGPSETSTSVTDATSTMPAENQPENLSSSQVLTVPNRATPPSGISLPPSPSMAGFRPTLMTLPSPSELDLSTGNPERHSILKAISGLWLQSAPTLRQTMDVEDPLDDPEHIFRDASMVVRTDEPTSIIALALKYSSLSHLVFRFNIFLVHRSTAICS